MIFISFAFFFWCFPVNKGETSYIIIHKSLAKEYQEIETVKKDTHNLLVYLYNTQLNIDLHPFEKITNDWA